MDNNPIRVQIRKDSELNAIVESISFAKPFHYKKLTFQAFSAAIANPEHVRFVLEYLGNVNNTLNSRFPSAKNKIIAYRVNGGKDGITTGGPLNQSVKVQGEGTVIEGFDDDGEAGSGEKLLGLLQKMEVENIIVIICIWSSGATLGNQVRGGELYKVILDRAKELLSSIHEQIKVQIEEVKRKNEVEW